MHFYLALLLFVAEIEMCLHIKIVFLRKKHVDQHNIIIMYDGFLLPNMHMSQPFPFTLTRQVTRATHVRTRVCPRVELILKIIIILLIIFLGFIKSKPC